MIKALQAFAHEHNRQPSFEDWRGRTPSLSAIKRLFGTWGSAMEAAGFRRLAPGAHDPTRLDQQTARVIERLRNDVTLREIAAEIGISGQALGRRVVRYQRRFNQEPLKLKRGPRPKKVLQEGSAKEAR